MCMDTDLHSNMLNVTLKCKIKFYQMYNHLILLRVVRVQISLTCIEHSMTETAMTASSIVTCSLYISLAWAGGGKHEYYIFIKIRFPFFVNNVCKEKYI